MKNKIKIGILGGDKRLCAVSAFFEKDGFECAAWGMENVSSELQSRNIVKTLDWQSTLSGADAVILPLPITTDGVRLNCNQNLYQSNLYVPRLTEILDNTDKATLLFGGKIPQQIHRLASERKLKLIDYYEFEEFQIKNAVPTAEGAIALAIKETPMTLFGSKAAIVGYGRIGRTLSLKLIALGCKVTCIARSKKDLAWAECDGCDVIKLNKYAEIPERFDIIFNTVPHVIFNNELIDKLPKNQLFIDLASLNGGIDVKSAEKRGIRVIKALSLPGKCSPITAGKIIYDSIKELLKEEGIL